MSNVVRWDPFTTMDRLFDVGFSRPWRLVATEGANGESAGFAVEVSETESELEVRASLPGIRPEDVDVTVNKDVLTIKAEHKTETKDEKRDYYRREIRYGSFQRSMTLPVQVDADKAVASFDNGLLRLQLPKAEALRPKQIKVTSATTDTPVIDGSAN